MSRVDRGYYHYMNNISALSFNMVDDSGRSSDQDTYNFFSVCNDNLNDYVGSKEANYFMVCRFISRRFFLPMMILTVNSILFS